MSLYPVDLHSHTTASDGTHTPTQLVERAVQRGLRVLGIADHDTVDGLAEAQTAAEQFGLEIVPAIEFSTRIERAKHFVGIHLLGYFINPTHPTLNEIIGKIRQGRIDQKIKQIELLQSFGFAITVEDVFATVTGVPGRPHIAAVLMEKNPEKFQTIQQIFDEYLGANKKAHVGREFVLTVGEAIELVKQIGGVSVLAHPGAYSSEIDPIVAVRNAKAEGVQGVEVFYPYHQKHQASNSTMPFISQIENLADELNLLKSGGTDFHGRPNEEADLGDMGLTNQQFAVFRQGWQEKLVKPEM